MRSSRWRCVSDKYKVVHSRCKLAGSPGQFWCVGVCGGARFVFKSIRKWLRHWERGWLAAGCVQERRATSGVARQTFWQAFLQMIPPHFPQHTHWIFYRLRLGRRAATGGRASRIFQPSFQRFCHHFWHTGYHRNIHPRNTNNPYHFGKFYFFLFHLSSFFLCLVNVCVIIVFF